MGSWFSSDENIDIMGVTDARPDLDMEEKPVIPDPRSKGSFYQQGDFLIYYPGQVDWSSLSKNPKKLQVWYQVDNIPQDVYDEIETLHIQDPSCYVRSGKNLKNLILRPDHRFGSTCSIEYVDHVKLSSYFLIDIEFKTNPETFTFECFEYDGPILLEKLIDFREKGVTHLIIDSYKAEDVEKVAKQLLQLEPYTKISVKKPANSEIEDLFVYIMRKRGVQVDRPEPLKRFYMMDQLVDEIMKRIDKN